MRTDLPGVGTVWRDRYAPKRTVKVMAGSAGLDSAVVSKTLTDDTGKAPATVATNHTQLSEWDWMYERTGLGAS